MSWLNIGPVIPPLKQGIFFGKLSNFSVAACPLFQLISFLEQSDLCLIWWGELWQMIKIKFSESETQRMHSEFITGLAF